MAEIHLTYLNGLDVDRLAMGDQEILDAVEGGLLAQGTGQAVIEPSVDIAALSDVFIITGAKGTTKAL